MNIKSFRNAIGRFNVSRVSHLSKSFSDAARHDITTGDADHYFVWEQPNRANTPPLHIAGSGERYPTLTGLSWLDDTTVMVDHRSGFTLGIFDLGDTKSPIWTTQIGYQTDDLAAWQLSDTTWDIAVSGCWDAKYGRYTLTKTPSGPEEYSFVEKEIALHDQRDFCHGVAYDDEGQLCYALHTGKKPRVVIGTSQSRIPYPWGARDLCYDGARDRYIAVTVSANPRQSAYSTAATALWSRGKGVSNWTCFAVYEDTHSDSVFVWNDMIGLPDQLNDRLILLDAISGDVAHVVTGDCFEFPHGVDMSRNGKLALSNYGSSSVAILDLAAITGP